MWLGRLDPLYVALWLGLTSLFCTGAWWLMRGPMPSRARRAFMWSALGCPAAAVLVSLVAFGSGGHPLVQYDGGRGMWSFWFHMWPLLVLAALACSVISFGMIFARQGDRQQAGWGLLLIANAITLLAVLGNFPSV